MAEDREGWHPGKLLKGFLKQEEEELSTKEPFCYIVMYAHHMGADPRESLVAIYATEELAKKRIEEAKSFHIDMIMSKWRIRTA